MSSPAGAGPGRDTAIERVTQFWSAKPPAALRRLYDTSPTPALPPCEFLSLDAIASGEGRSYGMLPQFLPFGRAMGDAGLYGFYLTPDTQGGSWPVLYYDDEGAFLRPVASDFDSFLRYLVLLGRYEVEGDSPGEESAWLDAGLRETLRTVFGIPDDLLSGPIPGNDTDLQARIADSDPRSAEALCSLACIRRENGDAERALDFAHRAVEAAPWFGDAPYLLATLYYDRSSLDRATGCWWSVMQKQLFHCTRTSEWNLGESHPDGDIYEVAADGLRQFESHATDEMRESLLWNAVAVEDPYDPISREALARRYANAGDDRASERELLNAMMLYREQADDGVARVYESLVRLYDATDRHRCASLARFDARLPQEA